MRPIDTPAPNPSEDPINQNHDDVRPTLEKKYPQIRINKVLATDHIDVILSRTLRHSFTVTTVKQYFLTKSGPRGEVARCDLFPK